MAANAMVWTTILSMTLGVAAKRGYSDFKPLDCEKQTGYLQCQVKVAPGPNVVVDANDPNFADHLGTLDAILGVSNLQ
jgi:hypothetical protein